jgi:rhodanese-related sulfurtransferase
MIIFMTHSELVQKRGENPNLQVIDIREADELDTNGAIEGADHISMGRMFIKAAQGELSKDVEMVVYCASGTRAGIVARELSDKGYNILSVTEAFPVKK